MNKTVNSILQKFIQCFVLTKRITHLKNRLNHYKLPLYRKKDFKMNSEEFSIDALKNALTTLNSCWEVYTLKKNDTSIADIVADSCVKRFEYTMETSLKLMRKYLKLVYAKEDKELTVNNIFRLMAGYDMIQNWENWKLYYVKRNDTSHEYNIEKARELLKIIPQFIADVEFLVTSFENALTRG